MLLPVTDATLQLNPPAAEDFLAVVLEPLQRGDAEALARAVTCRWTAGQLCCLLKHERADVRRVVAVTLGLVGDGRLSPCLARALHDPDDQVNQMAEHGLWAIWFRSGSAQASGPFRDGVSLLAGERYAEAVRAFDRALDLDRTFAEAFNQRAIARFFLGQFRASIDDCQRTVALLPQHFGAIAGMGHNYVELGELSRALSCYRRALAINPRMSAVAAAIKPLEQRWKSSDLSGQFNALPA